MSDFCKQYLQEERTFPKVSRDDPNTADGINGEGECDFSESFSSLDYVPGHEQFKFSWFSF